MSYKSLRFLLISILIALVLLNLISCSNADIGEAENTYTATTYNYPIMFDDIEISVSAYLGGRMYVLSYVYDETDSLYSYTLTSFNFDGTDIQEHCTYAKQELCLTECMVLDLDGSIWFSETLIEGSVTTLIKLGQDGSIEAEYPVNISESTDSYINNLYVAADGVICILSGDTLFTLSPDGETLTKISTEVYSLAQQSDGTVYACAYAPGQGRVILPIDTAKLMLGSPIVSLEGVWAIFSGEGIGYDFIGYGTTSAYGYDIKTGKQTILINWSDLGIDPKSIYHFMVIDDGSMFCGVLHFDDMVWTERLLLEQTSSPMEKVVIKLATFNQTSTLTSAVNAFNKENYEYTISITDYSQYNDANSADGLTKLNTEIISGNVPDIIDLNGLPLDKYISKGILEDLYPYIDNDTELERSFFSESVMKLLDYNGALYEVVSGVSAFTVIAPTSEVGNKSGWTYSEFKALLETKPEGTQAFLNLTRDMFLQYSCYFFMDHYVDWATDTASFNSGEFIDLLEYCATLPAEVDTTMDDRELISEGNGYLSVAVVIDFLESQYFESFYGGEITYIGFPSENMSGSSLYLNTDLAMTSVSQHKDVVWDFLRTFLTEDYQTEKAKTRTNFFGFPTNVNALNAMIEEAMQPDTYEDEQGNLVETGKNYTFTGDDDPVLYRAATRDQIDKIMDLVSSADSVVRINDSIVSIVMEEAKAVFLGTKTSEAAAEIIQNRINIYVSEQS